MNTCSAQHFVTSPLILSPFEAERKPAILPASPGFAATGDRALNHNWDLAFAKVKSANSKKKSLAQITRAAPITGGRVKNQIPISLFARNMQQKAPHAPNGVGL